MPPGAAPTKPGVKGKPLPKWVWLVAIAGGLAVGFLLLKKSPSQGEGEGGEGGGEAQGGDGSGGGAATVVSPLDEALGLKPPSEAGGFNVGYGGSFDSGGGGDSFDSGGGTSKQQLIQEALAGGDPRASVTKSGSTTTSGSKTIDSGTRTTTLKSGGGSTSGGGGSQFFKAA